MKNPLKYINDVAWRTIIRNVQLISEATDNSPSIFRITINPYNSNDPGAYLAQKVIGYYIKDNVGHTYRTIDFNVNTIDVSDDFRVGDGPQSGRIGIYFKSVFSGRAPYLAPIYYCYLDKCAKEYSEIIEKDILWSNDPNPRRLPFVNTLTPLIEDYQNDKIDENGVEYNLQNDYDNNPKFEVHQETEPGKHSIIYIGSEITRVNGLIQSVLFSSTGEQINGYILISK